MGFSDKDEVDGGEASLVCGARYNPPVSGWSSLELISLLERVGQWHCNPLEKQEFWRPTSSAGAANFRPPKARSASVHRSQLPTWKGEGVGSEGVRGSSRLS